MVNDSQQRRPPQPSRRFIELLQAGTQALQAGQVTQAISLLGEAQQLDRSNGDVRLNLAGAYILAKKFKPAVDLLEPLSRQEPHNAMVWTNLGAAYLGNPVLAKDDDQQKAIAAFEQALAIDPVAPNVAYNLGLIYLDRRDHEQALRWFQRAVQANPLDRDARNYVKKLSVD
jgi:tetratricopeptide (TPR) repeat protein